VLQDAGVEVTVLEARDRVGGRVHTHRHEFVSGQYGEGGAEWVSTTHHEVIQLAAELGVVLNAAHPANEDTWLLDAAGRIARYALWDKASQGQITTDVARWRSACDALAAQLDPVDPAASAVAAGLDGKHAGSLMSELDLHSVARLIVGRMLRTEFMVNPTQISQAHLAWMRLLENEAGLGYEAFRVARGSDSLTYGLAERVGDRIRLSSPVSAIRALGAGVSVTMNPGWRVPTANGFEMQLGPTETLGADAVIVAIPLPVLSRIYLDPPLPEGLVASYGIGGKVSVQFDKRAWQNVDSVGSVLSDRSYGEMWETSQADGAAEGVLTALLSSDDSATILNFPDAADRVAKEMTRLFPDLAGLGGARSLSDWSNDPQSLGTYAAFAPGEMTRLLPLLRADYGRIVLAGEHTDRFAGFMEGAIRSGLSAARRLLV
jgi:monoamine oxidase